MHGEMKRGRSGRSSWKSAALAAALCVTATAAALVGIVPSASAQLEELGKQGTATPSPDGSGKGSTTELFTVPMCDVVKWAAGRGYQFSIYREQTVDKAITSWGFFGLVLENVDFKIGKLSIHQEIGHMACVMPGAKKIKIDNWTKSAAENIRFFFFIDAQGKAKKLDDRWTFEGITFEASADPQYYNWDIPAKNGTSDPSFAIRVLPLKAGDNRVSSTIEIESIALRGPKGADWKQAFRMGGLGSTCIDNSDCDSKSCDPGDKRCVSATGTGVLYSYCTKDTQCSNMVCYSKSCRVPLGGTCSSHSACISEQCDQNKRCFAQGNQAKDGEYCSNTNQCSTSSYCPSSNSNCKKREGIGGSCSGGDDWCKADLGCDGNKRCFAAGNQAKDGEYCSNTNQCSTSSICPSSNSTCRKRADIGDSCNANGDCLPGLACDNSKRHCTAGPNQARDGQYCTNTNQCSTSSFCPSAGATCKSKLDVPRNSLGSDSEYGCTSNEQCKSNFCNYPGTSRCFPAQNTGAAGYFCVNNANCYAGHQCNLQSGKNWGYCN